jgi:hypothetical protein
MLDNKSIREYNEDEGMTKDVLLDRVYKDKFDMIKLEKDVQTALDTFAEKNEQMAGDIANISSTIIKRMPGMFLNVINNVKEKEK